MTYDILLYMPYVWLGAAVLLAIAEAMTDQLVAIWFAAGAVVCMFVSYTRIPVWLQLLLFMVVSSAVLGFLRPMATKAMKNRQVRTNVGSLIGMVGVVTTEVDNTRGLGRIRVNNSDWAAFSEDGQVISVGEQVLVKAIAGVKAVVEPII